MNDYKKYLDPLTVAGLNSIELKAKMVVEGFITGLHKSPYHGFSVEFAEHRQYRQGDEVKNIDWKVYARSNKYFVKQYEEETNLRSMILLDASASMNFKSDKNISKFEYGSYLAAALSYMMMKQRDAVGFALYDEKLRKMLPPKSKPSYLNEILRTIDEAKVSGKTNTSDSLNNLAEMINRRSLVIVISDFFDDLESISNAIKHFRHKQNEVILFQILDPRELDLDFGRAANFIDLESGEEMLTNTYQIKESYKKQMESYIQQLKLSAYKQKVDYNLVLSSDSFDKALRSFLSKRAKI